MHWNEREGNQKEKIIKNGTRWGQILCSGKKCYSSAALQKEETVYMCLCIYHLWKKNSFFCMLFKIACFFTFNSANMAVY